MKKIDIAQRIANIHNVLTMVQVSGDSVLYLGDALRDLRSFVQELQKDVEAEEAENAVHR